MEQKAIAKRSSQYFFVMVFVSIMHVAGNFVIAKLFTVAGYGAFGFLFLILSLGILLHLGLENAFGKQYPVEVGQGNKERAVNLRDSALTFSMMVTLSAMFLIIIAAIFWPGAEFEKRWAYIFIALTLPLQLLVDFYRTFFRVTMEFGRINKMQMIFGFFEFVLRVAPVYYFVQISPSVEYAFIGLFVGIFLSFGLTISYAWIIAPEKIKIRWMIPEVKYLFKLGIPIFIVFFMDSLFKSGDKFMAEAFFQDTGMGYYNLSSQIAGLLYFVPFAIGWVIFPLMLQKYGETHDGQMLAQYIFPPTSTIIQIILPLGTMLYLSLDFLIPAVLSKYNPSIPAAKILIPGLFFWSIVNMITYFLIAVDDRKRMIFYQAISLLMNLILNWYFGVVLGMYISGIALGTSVAYFLYSILIMKYSITKYFSDTASFVKYYLKMFMINLVTFGTIVAADQLFLRDFWSGFFSANSVYVYLSRFGILHPIRNNLIMNGVGLFLVEMLAALIFSGIISLAIRRWKLLAFDARFKKA
jgi:O-antigen/teichoic acid export membrane protein